MTEMTPRERLLAAIRFHGPDRVPVAPRMWRYMLAHGGSQRTEAYLKYAEEFGLDPMIHASAGPVVLFPRPESNYAPLGPTFRVEETARRETDGRTVVRTIHTPAGTLTDRTRIPKPGGQFGIAPNNHIEEHLVKGPEDLPALRALVEAWAAAHRGSDIRAVERQVGQRGLVMANTQSALSHNAGDCYPLDRMMIDCFENRPFVEELIDVFHRPLMAATKSALEQGVAVVYCSTFFESMSAGWSPALYRELFLPRIREHVELTHGCGALYHLYDDGKMAATLPMWRELGVDLVSTLCPPPSGDITLAQARQIAGDCMCLNGGIDTVNTIWRGTPQSIDAAVREAIAAAATPEGGYILGTSDSITEETPPENFRAFFDAGRRHGLVRAEMT
jgi:uroporphyrinogen-III decarboxylase